MYVAKSKVAYPVALKRHVHYASYAKLLWFTVVATTMKFHVSLFSKKLMHIVSCGVVKDKLVVCSA